jgi:hypothetical protein
MREVIMDKKEPPEQKQKQTPRQDASKESLKKAKQEVGDRSPQE